MRLRPAVSHITYLVSCIHYHGSRIAIASRVETALTPETRHLTPDTQNLPPSFQPAIFAIIHGYALCYCLSGALGVGADCRG